MGRRGRNVPRLVMQRPNSANDQPTIRLVCEERSSLTFGEDADKLLHENILAVMSQHQRRKTRGNKEPDDRAGVQRLLGISSARKRGKILIGEEPAA